MKFLQITFLLALSLLFCSNRSVDFHNPLLATFEMTEGDGEWLMTISLSQEGSDNALKKHFGIAPKRLEQAEYKRLLIKYIRSTSQIVTSEGEVLKFGKAAVKIDRHKIDMVFNVKNMPTDLSQLDFEIKAFAENPGHYNIVKFIGLGKREALVLSAKNNFTLSLSIP